MTLKNSVIGTSVCFFMYDHFFKPVITKSKGTLVKREITSREKISMSRTSRLISNRKATCKSESYFCIAMCDGKAVKLIRILYKKFLK